MCPQFSTEQIRNLTDVLYLALMLQDVKNIDTVHSMIKFASVGYQDS